ncbi:MAG TPA: hypothetical protein [Caudoviricetes sp.]|nr:MAG TPA: hypothetical protein [Caudoviricetes sp.]
MLMLIPQPRIWLTSLLMPKIPNSPILSQNLQITPIIGVRVLKSHLLQLRMLKLHRALSLWLAQRKIHSRFSYHTIALQSVSPLLQRNMTHCACLMMGKQSSIMSAL